jgi:hypothetical protein
MYSIVKKYDIYNDMYFDIISQKEEFYAKISKNIDKGEFSPLAKLKLSGKGVCNAF